MTKINYIIIFLFLLGIFSNAQTDSTNTHITNIGGDYIVSVTNKETNRIIRRSLYSLEKDQNGNHRFIRHEYFSNNIENYISTRYILTQSEESSFEGIPDYVFKINEYYKNEILKSTKEFTWCTECEINPSGVWRYFNEKGEGVKIIDTSKQHNSKHLEEEDLEYYRNLFFELKYLDIDFSRVEKINEPTKPYCNFGTLFLIFLITELGYSYTSQGYVNFGLHAPLNRFNAGVTARMIIANKKFIILPELNLTGPIGKIDSGFLIAPSIAISPHYWSPRININLFNGLNLTSGYQFEFNNHKYLNTEGFYLGLNFKFFGI